MDAVAHRVDLDGGRLGSVPGRVGQQVVQHLDDAPPVCHHQGQVRRQVDVDGLPAAAAQERGPGLIHQGGHRGRFGVDRQRAGVEASRIQQVADQVVHLIGLCVDDPEELPHLRPVQGPRAAQHGRRRTLDGGERRAQLVAHHAQEVGPQPLQLLERRQVLQGDDQRLGGAVGGMDRRGVDQHRDAPAIGDREHDLLGAHRRGAADHLLHGEFREGDLAPVGEAARHHLQQLHEGVAGRAEPLDDPPRLPVERQRIAGLGVEHDDTDRRGLHQGLEVGSRPLLGTMGAGVGDRGRRLRGEQHQDLLVVGRELLSALLLSEKESADVHAPVTHRRRLQGLRQHQVRGVAERADVGGEILEPERPGKVAEVFEQAQPVRPVQQLPLLFRGEAGSDEFLRLARLVDRRDEAVARAGQRACGIDDLAQDRAHVEARADAQDGGVQAGAALPQDLDFPRLLVALIHRSSLATSPRARTRFALGRRRRCETRRRTAG